MPLRQSLKNGWMDYKDAERVLLAYDLVDVFYFNDLTEEDVLVYLVNQEFLKLPQHLPLVGD